MSFDLKKFLTENKLTKASIKEEVNFYTMDQVVNMADRAGNIVLDAKDALHDLAVAYGERIPSGKVQQVLSDYDLELVDVLDTSTFEGSEVSENEEMQAPVAEEPAAEGVDVSRYLNLESAEAVIKEIESEVARVSLETKINKIKEAIEALDGKANGLEEDSNLQGFVNPARLKEMRRMTKKLRIMQERYAKEYDKKFNKKNNKKVTTEAAQRAFGGTKTVHTAGSILEPILGQVNTAGNYNVAKAIVVDAINNSGVAQEVKDKMIADVEGTKTYERLLKYVYNAYLAKAGLRSPDSGSRMEEELAEEEDIKVRTVSRADAGKAIRGTTEKSPRVGADYKGMRDDQIRTVKRPVAMKDIARAKIGMGPQFKK